MTDAGSPAYEADVRAAWAARDERLRGPHDWLSVVGLWWLDAGSTTFGAAAGSGIRLVGEHLPARAGVLRRDGATVWLEEADAALRVNGSPAGEMQLADDQAEEPSVLELGEVRMHVIRRGERLGLRVRDPNAPARRAFTGIDRYPIDPSWRLVGRVEPGGARPIEIVDVIGDAVREQPAAWIRFARGGRTWRLAALPGDTDGSLWLIFADATNGHGTYGGGRYLLTEPPAADGSVVVDFNLAYNPPCVFTPYATCPLPPPENRLDLEIEAGELASPADHR